MFCLHALYNKLVIFKYIYIRNIDGTFNHEELIEYTIEVELFHRGHNERTEIDMIGV